MIARKRTMMTFMKKMKMTTISSTKTLIVLVGPTAVGKTEVSIAIARHLQTEIISADSRQLYKEMSIGTAVPEQEFLSLVPHHFIQTHSIQEYYSSYDYEQDVLILLEKLFQKYNNILLTGGSMLYVDAICKGIDDIPTISTKVRKLVEEEYAKYGLEYLQKELKSLDLDFYKEIDLQNPKRVMHAVEVCREAGRPYSFLRTNKIKKRPFRILKIGLDRERAELYERINKRVDIMLDEGLEKEAKRLFPMRGVNALKTVGYKELFGYFEGMYDNEEAIRLIKRNSRHYAKRQLSWFRKDEDICWFHPNDIDGILFHIDSQIKYHTQ